MDVTEHAPWWPRWIVMASWSAAPWVEREISTSSSQSNHSECLSADMSLLIWSCLLTLNFEREPRGEGETKIGGFQKADGRWKRAGLRGHGEETIDRPNPLRSELLLLGCPSMTEVCWSGSLAG